MPAWDDGETRMRHRTRARRWSAFGWGGLRRSARGLDVGCGRRAGDSARPLRYIGLAPRTGGAVRHAGHRLKAGGETLAPGLDQFEGGSDVHGAMVGIASMRVDDRVDARRTPMFRNALRPRRAASFVEVVEVNLSQSHIGSQADLRADIALERPNRKTGPDVTRIEGEIVRRHRRCRHRRLRFRPESRVRTWSASESLVGWPNRRTG